MQLALPAGATPTPSTAPSPSASAAGGASYTIAAGDSLSRIANRFGVRLSALLDANAMTATSLILPGMRITLPAGATAPAQATTPAANAVTPTPAGSPTAAGSYTIAAGDSLSRIANRFGVRLSALLDANHLAAGSLILPGQRLTLPAGAVVPVATPGPATTPSAAASPDPARSRSSSPTSIGASGNARIDSVLAYALAQQGKPYRFFSAGPDSFDCSGLTLAAFAAIGVSLPHQSAQQALLGSPVDTTTESIRPGDLVFLSTHGEGVINHVGIAVTSTTYVHAPRTGETVRVNAIPASVVAVRRIVTD
jgi:cell wall-associated NlpC family hydrolase